MNIFLRSLLLVLIFGVNYLFAAPASPDVDCSSNHVITLLQADDAEAFGDLLPFLDLNGLFCNPGDEDRLDTLMGLAIFHNAKECVRLLIECDAELINLVTPLGATPLTRATVRERREIVGLLLQAGADPAIQDVLGYFPLQIAAATNDSGLVKLLLDHGVDPDICERGGTPLWLALSKDRCPEIVELLLAEGARLIGLNDKGQSAFDAVQTSPPDSACRKLVEGAWMRYFMDGWTLRGVKAFQKGLKRVLSEDDSF